MGGMKPTPEGIKAWRRQAESDLRNARRNAEIGAHDVCVLLCQQAAEKLLKAAYMAVKGEEAPFTHNLAILLRELDAPATLIGLSAELTADYITTRYPVNGAEIPAEAYGTPASGDRLSRAEEIIEWAGRVLDEALSGDSG